ncbi:MAG TPA: hypothetical protein VHN77_03810 [Phycisphaerales bacterium]|nr:hypothetical protein [Phycisphaerales bacterium]
MSTRKLIVMSALMFLALCIAVPVILVLLMVAKQLQGTGERMKEKLALAQLSAINSTLYAYALQYNDVPPTVSWDTALINAKYLPAARLEHPSLPRGSGAIGYVYIHRTPIAPGDGRDPTKTIVMYERSSLMQRSTYNILYLDGSIVTYPKPQFEAIIKASTDDAGAPLPPP